MRNLAFGGVAEAVWTYRARSANGNGGWEWWHEVAREVAGVQVSCAARVPGPDAAAGLTPELRRDLTPELRRDLTAFVAGMQVNDGCRSSVDDDLAWLALALKAARAGVWLWDVHTNSTWWDEQNARLYGYEPGTPFSMEKWWQAIHPEDRPKLEVRLAEFFASPDAVEWMGEFRVLHPEKGVRWHLGSGRLQRDAQGRPARFVGIDLDQTETKLAAEAMRQTESRYRLLMESMRDAFASVDLTGRLTDANTGFQELVGYSLDELTRLTYYDLTPARWHEMEDRIRREVVMVRGHSDVYEKEYRRKDGTLVPVEVHTFLIRDEAGRPVGMWAIVRDLTHRKRVEAELRNANALLEERVLQRTESLRQSEERFRTLATASFEGIVISERGIVLDCNDQMVTMLRMPREQILGRAVMDFLPATLRARVARSIDEGVEARREHELVRADGSTLVVEAHGRSPAGRDGLRITVFRDVTNRKLAEAAMQEVMAERERQQSELMQFKRIAELSEVSSGVLHQISQPISATFNNVTAARRFADQCPTGCSVREIIQDATASLRQVQLTMERLRALLHPERVRREAVSPNTLASEVAQVFAPQVMRRSLVLETELAPGLPELQLDGVQITQALINLLGNACDAAQECEGERRVIYLRTRLLEPGWVGLEVTDRGAGIRAEAMTNLFSPFFTTKPNGMGVGLCLSRRIVMAHGGAVEGFNNADGAGATFRIRLPAVTHPKEATA